jgi:hypothetical protein
MSPEVSNLNSKSRLKFSKFLKSLARFWKMSPILGFGSKIKRKEKER